MKKLLSCFLALIMILIAPLYAVADNDIDLSNLSVEELLKLHEDILTELEKKGYSKSATLQIGTYIAGVDIPSGTYTLELSETADPNQYGYFNYDIYDTDGKCIEYNTMEVSARKITLNEGYKLEIERAPVKIKTYAIIWQ